MGSSISTDLNESACCSQRKERLAHGPEEDDAPSFGLPDSSCLSYCGNDEVSSVVTPAPPRARRGFVPPQGPSAAEKGSSTKVGRVQEDIGGIGAEATPVARLGSRVLTG